MSYKTGKSVTKKNIGVFQVFYFNLNHTQPETNAPALRGLDILRWRWWKRRGYIFVSLSNKLILGSGVKDTSS